jgi:hypothetical protein
MSAGSLPEVLQDLLSRVPPPDQAVVVAVTDEAGWPHFALVSFWELLWRGDLLHLALGRESRTAALLGFSGRCSLGFFGKDGVFYLKARCRSSFGTGLWEIFPLVPEWIKEDFPHAAEGAVRIVSGVDFEMSPAARDTRSAARKALIAAVSRTAG